MPPTQPTVAVADSAAVAPSLLARLHAELEEIEGNFHNLAEPQLAIAGKVREIIAEVVKAIESTDFAALGAKVDAAIAQIEPALEQFESLKTLAEEGKALYARLGSFEELGKKAEAAIEKVETIASTLSSLSSSVSALSSRVSNVEQHPALSVPLQQGNDTKAPASDAPAAPAGAQAT